MSELFVEIKETNGAYYNGTVVDIDSNGAYVQTSLKSSVEKYPFDDLRFPPDIWLLDHGLDVYADMELYSCPVGHDIYGWWQVKVLNKNLIGEGKDSVYTVQYAGPGLEYMETCTRNQLRPVNFNPPLTFRSFHKFIIPVPENLREVCSRFGELNLFKEKIKAGVCQYNEDMKSIIVISRYSRTRKLVRQKKDELFDYLKKRRVFAEVRILESLVRHVTNKKTGSIYLARRVPGVHKVELVDEKGVFIILGESPESVNRARNYIEIVEEVVQVPLHLFSALFSKGKIQQLIENTGICRVKTNLNSKEMSSVEVKSSNAKPILLIGNPVSVDIAKNSILLDVRRLQEADLVMRPVIKQVSCVKGFSAYEEDSQTQIPSLNENDEYANLPQTPLWPNTNFSIIPNAIGEQNTCADGHQTSLWPNYNNNQHQFDSIRENQTWIPIVTQMPGLDQFYSQIYYDYLLEMSAVYGLNPFTVFSIPPGVYHPNLEEFKIPINSMEGGIGLMANTMPDLNIYQPYGVSSYLNCSESLRSLDAHTNKPIDGEITDANQEAIYAYFNYEETGINGLVLIPNMLQGTEVSFNLEKKGSGVQEDLRMIYSNRLTPSHSKLIDLKSLLNDYESLNANLFSIFTKLSHLTLSGMKTKQKQGTGFPEKTSVRESGFSNETDTKNGVINSVLPPSLQRHPYSRRTRNPGLSESPQDSSKFKTLNWRNPNLVDAQLNTSSENSQQRTVADSRTGTQCLLIRDYLQAKRDSQNPWPLEISLVITEEAVEKKFIILKHSDESLGRDLIIQSANQLQECDYPESTLLQGLLDCLNNKEMIQLLMVLARSGRDLSLDLCGNHAEKVCRLTPTQCIVAGFSKRTLNQMPLVTQVLLHALGSDQHHNSILNFDGMSSRLLSMGLTKSTSQSSDNSFDSSASNRTRKEKLGRRLKPLKVTEKQRFNEKTKASIKREFLSETLVSEDGSQRFSFNDSVHEICEVRSNALVPAVQVIGSESASSSSSIVNGNKEILNGKECKKTELQQEFKDFDLYLADAQKLFEKIQENFEDYITIDDLASMESQQENGNRRHKKRSLVEGLKSFREMVISCCSFISTCAVCFVRRFLH